MAELPNEIDRINALTTNARNTWFALLGVLVFVSITLMGVEHIDFYGVNRATELPLVDVEVPTRLFFIAAPILTFAIYGYFHLYLIRLWDALGAADPFYKRKPLGDVISPWLVSDAALHLRNKKRKDKCTTPRSLEFAAMILNVALAWGFGLAVLVALWWTSMAARDPVMTSLAGVMLIAAGWVGLASWLVMRRRMRGLTVTEKRPVWAWIPLGLGGVAAIAFVAVVGIERSSAKLNLFPHAVQAKDFTTTWLARNEPIEEDTIETGTRRGGNSGGFSLPEDYWFHDFLTLGPVNLAGKALVEKPDDWLPYNIARSDFRAKWCARESVRDCQSLSKDETKEFQSEWTTRRAAQIDALGKPEVNPVNPTQYFEMHRTRRSIARNSALNLRKADLRGAFLPGINLVAADLTGAQLSSALLEGANLFDAQMEGANLKHAQMEGANFTNAQLKGAYIFGAQMEGANLFGANLAEADLRNAQLDGAKLTNAQMESADLRNAQMTGAELLGTQMAGADLRRAQLESALLRSAQMVGVDLSFAQMEGTDLRGAQMEGTDLSLSRIHGRKDRLLYLTKANLSASTNVAGVLRFADLTDVIWDDKTDFRNAFMDASVLRTDGFVTRMGNPCQWVNEELNDQDFNSLWRWWLKELGLLMVLLPSDIRNTPLPTPERLAELGLTDCEPNQPFGAMPATE